MMNRCIRCLNFTESGFTLCTDCEHKINKNKMTKQKEITISITVPKEKLEQINDDMVRYTGKSIENITKEDYEKLLNDLLEEYFRW